MKENKNILILTYWSFKNPLIQAYTLPYVKIISKVLPKESKVYLFTLEKPSNALSKEEQRQVEEELKAFQIHLLPFKYFPFGPIAILRNLGYLIYLLFFIFFNRIQTIHTWCTPAGAFGYLLSLLTGRPLVLDSYEPHAEASIENGDWGKDSFSFKLLFFLERMQTKKASFFISTSKGMKDYAKEKYDFLIPKDRFFVKPACVDLTLFQPVNTDQKKKLRQELLKINESKIVAVYAGKLGGIYHEKKIFELLKVAAGYWGDQFQFLMLTNTSRERIEELADDVGLKKEVIISKFVPHSEVPKYLSLSDFGITPVKSVPSKRYCTVIKDGEYWAIGLPVLITKNISDDSQIIENNQIGAVIYEMNKEGYAASLNKIDQLLKQPELKTKIRNIAKKYRDFSRAEKIYKHIYL